MRKSPGMGSMNRAVEPSRKVDTAEPGDGPCSPVVFTSTVGMLPAGAWKVMEYVRPVKGLPLPDTSTRSTPSKASSAAFTSPDPAL